MTENPSLVLSDLVKGGLWGFNLTSGKWKPIAVNDAGELVTTTAAGGGGGGGDVRIKDASAANFASVDASGRLTVNVNGTVPVSFSEPISVDDNGGSLTVDGTVAVSNFPTTVDVTDRAARLLGVVYGSQGQQLKQTATNFNLQTEIAVGGTLVDPRDITDRDARVLGRVKLTDGTDVANVNALGSLEVSITTNPVPVSDGGNVLSVDDAGSTLSVDDGGGSLTVDGTVAVSSVSGNVNVKPYPTAAADILVGRAVRLNTVTAISVVTIPAGRTFVGSANISCTTPGTAAVTRMSADLRTAGTGVTPAAGTVLGEIITHLTGNTDGGRDAFFDDIIVVAPVGNAVTIDLKLSVANADFEAVATVRGMLL